MEEKIFTINDLQKRKEEAEMLEEKDKMLSVELEKIMNKDEIEIGE